MRTSEEMAILRARIVQLRREGRSRRQIKEILGPMSNSTLDDALRGEAPPEWTRRPNAKDALRARARELREQGLDYEEIAAALGVSKSSVSLWVRDMPLPARLSYEECRKRAAEGSRLYWETERPAREARREEVRAAAAGQIGVLSKRIGESEYSYYFVLKEFRPVLERIGLVVPGQAERGLQRPARLADGVVDGVLPLLHALHVLAE